MHNHTLSAPAFSRVCAHSQAVLPVVRTFISLPAGFARMDRMKFLVLTILGSLPWTALILWLGRLLGEGWAIMMKVGHEISIAFVLVCIVAGVVFYLRYKKKHKIQKRLGSGPVIFFSEIVL